MGWEGVDYTRLVQERNNELQGSVRCNEYFDYWTACSEEGCAS